MKKFIVIILVWLFVFGVSACSPKTYRESNQPTFEATQESRQPIVEVTPESNQPTIVVTQERNQPTVIHHKAPESKVNIDWVEKAGCPLDEYVSGFYAGTCSSDSPLRKMGCDEIRAYDLFGGLTYPVVECQNINSIPLGSDYSQVGCSSQWTESLLTFRKGNYQFIGAKDVKAMSVPIESPNEALSYVLATTNYYSMYDIEIKDYNEYFVDKIEETFIEETQDGYLLHLFLNLEPVCWCDNHYTDAVKILVDKEGNIELVDSYHVYNYDGCID